MELTGSHGSCGKPREAMGATGNQVRVWPRMPREPRGRPREATGGYVELTGSHGSCGRPREATGSQVRVGQEQEYGLGLLRLKGTSKPYVKLGFSRKAPFFRVTRAARAFWSLNGGKTYLFLENGIFTTLSSFFLILCGGLLAISQKRPYVENVHRNILVYICSQVKMHCDNPF